MGKWISQVHLNMAARSKSCVEVQSLTDWVGQLEFHWTAFIQTHTINDSHLVSPCQGTQHRLSPMKWCFQTSRALHFIFIVPWKPQAMGKRGFFSGSASGTIQRTVMFRWFSKKRTINGKIPNTQMPQPLLSIPCSYWESLLPTLSMAYEESAWGTLRQWLGMKGTGILWGFSTTRARGISKRRPQSREGQWKHHGWEMKIITPESPTHLWGKAQELRDSFSN